MGTKPGMAIPNPSTASGIVILGAINIHCVINQASSRVDGFAEKINVLADPPKLCQDMGEYNPAR